MTTRELLIGDLVFSDRCACLIISAPLKIRSADDHHVSTQYKCLLFSSKNKNMNGLGEFTLIVNNKRVYFVNDLTHQMFFTAKFEICSATQQ